MGRGGSLGTSPHPENMLRLEEGSQLPPGSWALQAQHRRPAGHQHRCGVALAQVCAQGGSGGSVALGRHEGPPCAGVMSHAWLRSGHAGAGGFGSAGRGVAWPRFQCRPEDEMAGTQRLFSLAGKCTTNQLNIKARQGRARTGTGVWHRDRGRLCTREASPLAPTCPQPRVPWLCSGKGPAVCIPMTRCLMQGLPHARALTARAEELPRAGRKPGAPRCSPCGSRPGGGMSQPRLSLLLLLLCCQVRTGHPARRCSAPHPARCLPPRCH